MPATEARNTLSASELFFAGGVSGIVEALAVQPLDMAKTRLQLMPLNRPPLHRALVDVVQEGGVLRLYRGVLPELAAMTPKSSAMYASYESTLRLLRPSLGDTAAAHFVAGLASGVPEALTVTPFQVVKVRLQAKEYLGRYTGTMQCVQRILAEEGLAAFTTGLHATIWRNSIWNSVYFALMGSLRPAIAGPEGSHPLVESARTLALGFVSGVVATAFNNPFDVVKSRIQAELRSEPAARGGLVGEAGFARLLDAWRVEGLAGLYAGFSAKALRMGVGGAVGMAAYEATAQWLARR